MRIVFHQKRENIEIMVISRRSTAYPETDLMTKQRLRMTMAAITSFNNPING